MTLGGLTLGVGMLVDNSIVVIENIYRHIEMGTEPKEAIAARGTGEVAMAITGKFDTYYPSSVSTNSFRWRSQRNHLQKELALTVTFSLLASLWSH